MTSLVTVEIEQALGPGVDFISERGSGLIGRRARLGGPWLGFDRGALADSDDGFGRRTRVLVALPASTFIGARLEVELAGGWSSEQSTVLVGTVPGGPSPLPALASIAAGLGGDATWFDRETAAAEALRARQRHRERAGHARIRGGRAWRAAGALPPDVARFATPHSLSEYAISRLPPRFLRGLEGLLDDDERILYWIERPLLADIGVAERLLRRPDRRAALLALTDRQLLWIVDHAQPDQYLMDWGVDVELIPVERVLGVRCLGRGQYIEMTVFTAAGTSQFVLPIELGEEVRVMVELVERFTPDAAGSLPRRRYPVDPIPFDFETAARFGAEAEARRCLDAAAAGGDVLAFLYSRKGTKRGSPAALILRSAAIELSCADRPIKVELDGVRTVALTLSPLAGRLSFEPELDISYPAPLMDRGAAFVRLARKLIANLP